MEHKEWYQHQAPGRQPYERRPYPQPAGAAPYGEPRPRIQEDSLKTGEIDVERKTFCFALKENPRGRFLRITEIKGGMRESILIPATGLKDFQKLLAEMLAAAAMAPAPAPATPPSGPV
jgi:hypothetical protein